MLWSPNLSQARLCSCSSADQALTIAFKTRASEFGLEVFSASSNPAAADSPAVYIDPHTPQRKIRALLPVNIDLFLNFGSSVTALESCLPKKCIISSFHNLVGAQSSAEVESIPDGVADALTKAQSIAQNVGSNTADLLVTSLSELSKRSSNQVFPLRLGLHQGCGRFGQCCTR